MVFNFNSECRIAAAHLTLQACTEQLHSLSRSHCTAASLTVRQWPRRSARPRVLCLQITRKRRPVGLEERRNEGRREGGSGVWEEGEGPASPAVPNYSQVSTLTLSPSIRASVSLVAVGVRQSRALFRSALVERLSRSRRGRTRAAFSSGERAGGRRRMGAEGEGAPNGLQTRTVSRKQARTRRGKLSRYTCY